MSTIVFAGPDPHDLLPDLEAREISIAHLEAPVTRATLDDAGIDEAAVYLLTDAEEATSIPIVRERNTEVRIVVYASEGISDFAGHQADLVVDPDAVDRSIVVDAVREMAGADVD